MPEVVSGREAKTVVRDRTLAGLSEHSPNADKEQVSSQVPSTSSPSSRPIARDRAARLRRLWRSVRLRHTRVDAPLRQLTRPAAARRRLLSAGRRDDGQALVEMALALPLLLLILTAILQFGITYNKYITLTDAVRAGARSLALEGGSLDPCDPAIAMTINSAINLGLSSSEVSPSFSNSSDTCGSGSYPSHTAGTANTGDTATITASVPFTISVFGMHVFNGTMSASASDEVE